MTATIRAALVMAVGVAVAGIAWLLGVDPVVSDLTFLAAALAAGELMELRPEGRAPLPLSFAVVTVIVTAAPWQVVIVVISAELVAAALRTHDVSVSTRGRLFAERCAEALSAGAAYQLMQSVGLGSERAVELASLTVAAVTPILIADLVTLARDRTLAPLRARGADVALVTSGILMAVGYVGLEGNGRLGLWGPVLFSIPLIAAWYSFELLASTRLSFDQTIHALAAAPELGGLAREGHAGRVADLAVSMGNVLDLGPSDLDHLRTAAQLHHLGAVCLDEPDGAAPLDPVEVARASAAMLRASEVLAPAGDVVAAEPLLHRPPGAHDQPPAALAGMILKVASAYDELTEGDDQHAAWAVEALYTGPGYVYDGRVLAALERVLDRRGLLVGR